MKKVLTIAGSDCSGGAGIQADIKTMTAHKVYAMSVITALTAQNTRGLYGVLEVPPDFVAQQMDCIFTDIVPHAVKIGMVSSGEIAQVIAEKLHFYNAKNIVIDPVMVSTSGTKLLKGAAMDAIISNLFPLACLITPNIPEAEALCGMKINTHDEMVFAAANLHATFRCAILLKGGHLDGPADDLLYWKGDAIWFSESRIESFNTHGTGCTLSSAIACNLAKGYNLIRSIREAKQYVSGALSARLNLGKGNGPIDHVYCIEQTSI